MSKKELKLSCPNFQINLTQCSCTYSPCNKRGLCCQCVAYHRKIRQIPGCFFNTKSERTYDRSYEKFCSEC